jgi:hypothetical protein
MTDDLTEFMPQEAIDESIASTQRIAGAAKVSEARQLCCSTTRLAGAVKSLQRWLEAARMG